MQGVQGGEAVPHGDGGEGSRRSWRAFPAVRGGWWCRASGAALFSVCGGRAVLSRKKILRCLYVLANEHVTRWVKEPIWVGHSCFVV